MSKNRNSVCVGFTCGSFDLLHAGHALMLEECKNVCDYLIVGLQTDPSIDRESKNRPVMSMVERHTMLNAVKYVDEIRTYETEDDLYSLLKQLHIEHPDVVRILGADWKGKKFTGYDLPIKTYFNSRNHGYSTTSLRERVYVAESLKKKS
ncbi:MAG: adenylyltransferase/cytidyltransferase family protein [Candidatus Thorarchaeota archaeon]